MPIIQTNPVKAQYSENEAAQALGISIDQLRSLIRNHIVTETEDLSNLAAASYLPSDLLLLRLLSSQLKSTAV